MNEKRILQDTLDWYLGKLSPNTRISGIKDLLSGIQSEIDSNHINEAVEMLVSLYDSLPAQLKAKTQFPGPTPEFRQLVINEEEGQMIGGCCGSFRGDQLGGGGILRDMINVNNADYKVLGLLLRSQDGRYHLYDLDTNSIVTEYSPTRSSGYALMPEPPAYGSNGPIKQAQPIHVSSAGMHIPSTTEVIGNVPVKVANGSPRFHTPETSPESSPRVEGVKSLKPRTKRIYQLPTAPQMVRRGENIYEATSAVLQ